MRLFLTTGRGTYLRVHNQREPIVEGVKCRVNCSPIALGRLHVGLEAAKMRIAPQLDGGTPMPVGTRYPVAWVTPWLSWRAKLPREVWRTSGAPGRGGPTAAARRCRARVD